MLKKLLLVSLLIIITLNIKSQEGDSLRKGIHQEESEVYSVLFPAEITYNEKGLETTLPLIPKKGPELTGKVLGWHPYWASSSSYLSYDYEALSHIAYFSYEVDTATGGYTTIRDWNTTPIISYAHERGTKVLLTVTNFGSAKNTKILSDTLLQKFMFNTLVALLKSRNGDGVNFDLETVNYTQRANLVNFMRRAVRMIKAELPAAEISMATPAVDWTGSWDLKTLSEICDYLVVMGYNYYWSSSPTAGPVAPLEGENYNVSRSVNTYLDSGVSPDKLMLGVPWYGYDWPVVNNYRKSPATGTATSRTFSAANQLSAEYGKTFDQATKVPWVGYSSSSLWRQLWYDDSESLGMKYNFVKSSELAGIGIWALSYEGGDKEMWSAIKSAFSILETGSSMSVKIYPNPVHDQSKIEYFLSEKSRVIVEIIDISGRIINEIVNEERETGFYADEFNAAGMANGFYICRIRAGKSVITKYIVIIK